MMPASAFTASLHVAPGRFTTMLNPRQILVFAPWQDVRFGYSVTPFTHSLTE
jgi:hypothetical protein